MTEYSPDEQEGRTERKNLSPALENYLEIIFAVVASVWFESKRSVGPLNLQNLITLLGQPCLTRLCTLRSRRSCISFFQGFQLCLKLLCHLSFLVFLHVSLQKARKRRRSLIDRTLNYSESMALVPQIRIVGLCHQVKRLTVFPLRGRGLR